jgi:hypothetical protein
VLGKPKLPPAQILRSGRSQADDYSRLHGLNLHFEPRAAGQIFQGRHGAGVKQAHCTLKMQLGLREEIEFWGQLPE